MTHAPQCHIVQFCIPSGCKLRRTVTVKAITALIVKYVKKKKEKKEYTRLSSDALTHWSKGGYNCAGLLITFIYHMTASLFSSFFFFF